MGRFDSDTPALAERAALNASRTDHDLEGWIFDHVPPQDGMRIADLGCGTGKQVFALASRVSSDTEIIGVDISPQAVTEVNARAEREGFANVRALCASLDECPAALPDGQFDLILSTYAIYYARDLAALLERLSQVLRPRGQLFLCGPGVGTNHEMIAIVNGLAAGRYDLVPEVEDFIGPDQIAVLHRNYSSVSTPRMTNTVTFTSPDEVLSWWRNHNMYRPEADRNVQLALEKIFSTDSQFRLAKNVLGVHARV